MKVPLLDRPGARLIQRVAGLGVGPLTSPDRRALVLGFLVEARADGARILCGDGSPADMARGFCLAPKGGRQG